MKVIGFIDDAQYELDAFKEVMENNFDNIKIISDYDLDRFLEKLGSEEKIDLLLFDLYFPIPGYENKVGDLLSKETLVKKTAHLHKGIDNFYDAKKREDQMGLLDLVRREAGNVMKNILHYYAQGPEGGLKIFEKVQAKHPTVPCAFLSRKRTPDDIEECLKAGALRVLLKPSPSLERNIENVEMSTIAKWGWEDNWKSYYKDFEILMKQDVLFDHLTRLEVLLNQYDFKSTRKIRRVILEAKFYRNREDYRSKDNKKFLQLIEKIKHELERGSWDEHIFRLVDITLRALQYFSER